jgi:RNA polymerase sigma-70 factor (ECF subfamily)
VVTTKKLASRARRRVRGPGTLPAANIAEHRGLVEAFLTAVRSGDMTGLLAMLAPDVVRRADAAGVVAELHGAQKVAEETRGNAARARFAVVAMVDGRVGAVIAPLGKLALALAFTIEADRITVIEVVTDPTRLRRLDLALDA